MTVNNNIENVYRIIAVDFDGTLSAGEYPNIIPNWKIIAKAKLERWSGARLILWTCREGKDLKEAVDACHSWGLEFDAINENIEEAKSLWGNDTRKVGATEVWDDRAINVKDLKI
jgi:hypothetical protein